MTRLPILALTSLATLVFAGCSALPQSVGEASMFYRDYVGPPLGSSTALMRLSADGVIRVTPNSACADFAKPETGVALFSTASLKDYSHLHNRKLGVKGDAPPGLTSTEIALEADKPVVISYTKNWTDRSMAYTCQIHRSFTPKAGMHYQLLAEPIFSERTCGVVIAELSEPPTLTPAVPAKLCGA